MLQGDPDCRSGLEIGRMGFTPQHSSLRKWSGCLWKAETPSSLPTTGTGTVPGASTPGVGLRPHQEWARLAKAY